jgi:CYTH domain-containing protein
MSLEIERKVLIAHDGWKAFVDVVIAEVELDRAERVLELRDWVGSEVTGNAGYSKIKMLEDKTAERRAEPG